jgi:hypothetical protein
MTSASDTQLSRLNKNRNIKTTRIQKLTAASLACALAFTTAKAQQVPLPKTAVEVPGQPEVEVRAVR